MENIVPALISLHLYGIILWAGGTVAQYLFLGSLKAENGEAGLIIELIRKTYHYMIWPGLAMVAISGLAIILFFGMEWLMPRGFIHIKITVAIILMLLTHLGWSRFKTMLRLMEKNEPESEDVILLDKAHRTWKTLLIVNLTGMGSVILIGVYKFGF